MRYLIVVALLLSACSSTPIEKKRRDVVECTKQLIEYDAETLEAFEVCRQVYKMRKVRDNAQVHAD